MPFFVLMTVLGVWLAVSRSPWYWLTALVPAAILVGQVVMPRRLERRAEELGDPGHGESSSGGMLTG